MPLVNQIHTDKLLSNISIKYSNAEYIASKVFPVVPVEKNSDLYRVWVRNFRLPNTVRAVKSVAPEHDFDVTTNSYNVVHHALKGYIADNEVQNYDVGDLRQDMTEELTGKIDLRLEKSVADLFTSTSWSLNVSLAAASQFSANTTVSNPIPVFDTAATTIVNNSGYKPNFGIIPRDVYVQLKGHVSILDRVKYTSSEMSAAILGSLFDLGELLIPHSVVDSSALGNTESIASLWGDNCFVGYKPARPSPLAPSSGYIFQLNKAPVRRWRDEERESEAIEVAKSYDAKVVASLTGYLIKDTLA